MDRMSTCPLCGTPVTDASGRYRIVLEIKDMTRSTKQFMGDETPVTRLFADRRLCADCWDDLFDMLASTDND